MNNEQNSPCPGEQEQDTPEVVTQGHSPSEDLDTAAKYQKHVNSLMGNYRLDKAMSLAVGGSYDAFGVIQSQLLIKYGLKPEHNLIDVGCGSGRLAHALADYLTGSYLGTDVVPELIDYARKRCPSSFRFQLAKDNTIPENDAQADIVCFFSLFTHILHEESYRFLLETKRVLKPGGKVLFSFLDFKVKPHWPIFQLMVQKPLAERPHLDVFLSRDAIEVWAEHLGMVIEEICPGDQAMVELPHPVKIGDGWRKQKIEGPVSLGQSIAVLIKPKGQSEDILNS